MEDVMFELADRFKELKDKKKQKELELRNLNDMIFEVESALAELMALKETQNFTHGNTSFSLRTSLKASAVSGKKRNFTVRLRMQGTVI